MKNTKNNKIIDYYQLWKTSIESDNLKYIIATDLDGTLLNDDGEISDFSRKVIEKIVAKGHIFCIITGRSKWNSIKYYRALKLNTILSNINGACIWHPKNKSFHPLYFCIKKDEIINILTMACDINKIDNILFETQNGISLLHYSSLSKNNLKNTRINFGLDKNRAKINDLHDNINNLKADIFGGMITIKDTNNESAQQIINEILYCIKRYSYNIVIRQYCINKTYQIIEFSSAFNDKIKALEIIAGYYNIPMKYVIAFGDSDNDKFMLNRVGMGFAMSNARDFVKNYASYLTKYSNNDDGVAKVLNHLFSLNIK